MKVKRIFLYIFIPFLLSFCVFQAMNYFTDKWEDFLEHENKFYQSFKPIPPGEWTGKSFYFCPKDSDRDITYKPNDIISDPGKNFSDRSFKILEVVPDDKAYLGLICKIQMDDDGKIYFVKGNGRLNSNQYYFPNFSDHPDELFNEYKKQFLNHVVWYVGQWDLMTTGEPVKRFTPLRVIGIENSGLNWDQKNYPVLFKALDDKQTMSNIFMAWSQNHDYGSMPSYLFYWLFLNQDPRKTSHSSEEQWSAILNHSVLVGMTRFQTFLALGKPQVITQNNNEEEWQYSSQDYNEGYPIGENVFNSIFFNKNKKIEKIESPEFFYENALLDKNNSSRNLQYFQLLNLYRVNNDKGKLCGIIDEILNEFNIDLATKDSNGHLSLGKDDSYSCELNHAQNDGHLVPLALLTKVCSCNVTEVEKSNILSKLLQNFGDEDWNLTNRSGTYGELVFYVASKEFCENALNDKALANKYSFLINLRLGDLALIAGDKDLANKYYDESFKHDAPEGSGGVFSMDMLKGAIDDDFEDFFSQGILPSRNLSDIANGFNLKEKKWSRIN